MKNWVKRRELSWKFYFAHHPLCTRFVNHVWNIGPLIVCQGCFMIFSGTIIGLFLFALTHVVLDMYQWFMVAAVCIIPSLLNEILKIQYQKLKHSIRFLNGIGFGGFIWAFLTVDLIRKLIAIVVAGILYTLLKLVRRRRMSYDICEGCIELTQKGICTGLKQEAEAMRRYSDYLTNKYQKNLKQNYLQKNN